MSKRTLEDLAPGERGTILSIGNQSGTVKRRLVDMGLTPGTEVRVTKVAPLGDPIEVSLRGYELSLRKADAAQIAMGQPGPGVPERPDAVPENVWAAPARAAAPPPGP